MNIYIKTTEGTFAAVRASRAEVNRLPQVVEGRWSVVPATAALRRAARLNVTVKTLRVFDDGRVGYL